ncbi:MAG: hypothetical protein WCA38_06510, partial [Candidatus Acidiferrales bacterium]
QNASDSLTSGRDSMELMQLEMFVAVVEETQRARRIVPDDFDSRQASLALVSPRVTPSKFRRIPGFQSIR